MNADCLTSRGRQSGAALLSLCAALTVCAATLFPVFPAAALDQLLASAAPAPASGVSTPRQTTDDASLAGFRTEAELASLEKAFAREVLDKTAAKLKKMGATAKKPNARAAGRLNRLTGRNAAYDRLVQEDAVARLRLAARTFDSSQFFVYVDAAPDRQLAFLVYYEAPENMVDPGQTGRTRIIGADLVSTGKLRRGDDSFITPAGVYEHNLDNYGYRAEGTKNSKGWRGLGAKGSRVWDFGFQQGLRQFPRGVYPSQMRLLMHATDPDFGEPRLGSADSKGCVRVSAQFNRFLDVHAILDRHYEEQARLDPTRWLLRADRTPVSRPGSLLIIGDTSNPVRLPETAGLAKP